MSTAPSMPAPVDPGRQRRMRFSVDAWDPAYGSSFELEDELGESTARVDVNIEVDSSSWAPVVPDPGVRQPGAVLFVDGVRRIDARVWIEDPAEGRRAGDASAGLCASYAAGVVCCCAGQAHLLTVETRRGMFTVAPHALDVTTSAGTFNACHTAASPVMPLSATLSEALQRRLTDVEVVTAAAARTELTRHATSCDEDLIVVDGPLRGRQHLPRTIGFIKSHRSAYLPPELHVLVARLKAGERTPAFLMGTSWDRHSWYLRLPCLPGAPWAGVVRIECSADLPREEVIALANVSQVVLGRFASSEYKDTRAPQNLYPIAGLERVLRHRLGDSRLLYRALRQAAGS